MTSAILATFSDVIGFLAQSFRLAAVFPAFVFVVLNEILIVPHLPQKGLIAQIAALDLSGQLVIAAVCSLLLGYTLTVVNIPLIRLFEGYPWRTTWPGDLLVERQEERRRKLGDRSPSLDKKISRLRKRAAHYDVGHPRRERLYRKRVALEEKSKVERLLGEQEIRNYFPIVSPVLPTTLGNTIAAFEDYPWDRYRIDAVVLWPRLLPTLTEEKYAGYVEREKAGLDFALNLCFLFSLLGLEIAYVGVLFGREYVAWLIGACVTLLLAFLFYKVAVAGAYGWGTTVRVAFDLYRYHLLRALYGHPPHDFPTEKRTWKQISRFLREGMDSEGGLSGKDMSRSLLPLDSEQHSESSHASAMPSAEARTSRSL
jgi:hypothetical protein